MKKRIFAILLITTLLFGGCQKSSDQFFSYHDYISSANTDLTIELLEDNFFAENITVLSDEDYGRDDEFIGAEAAFFLDATNNKAIYSKNPYQRLYPASLTKLMTALLVLRRGEISDNVMISYNASHITVPGAKVCGFNEGDLISLDALLHSLLIYSGNDAAIAIAEHISGSEEAFVKLMNTEAKKLGASHTNFVNSHGLHDDDHYSTAYDMYLIFNELISHDAFINIIEQISYKATYKDKDNNIIEKNFNTTNLYLREEREVPEDITIIGGKTGLTSRAGNCLILLSKDEDNIQYISLILKSSSIDQLYSDMFNMISMIKEENQ